MNRTAKGVADPEFHDTGNELCRSSVKYSEPENSLIRTDISQGIGIGKTFKVLASASTGAVMPGLGQMAAKRNSPNTTLI